MTSTFPPPGRRSDRPPGKGLAAEVLHESEHQTIASLGPVMIVIWKGPMSLSGVTHTRQAAYRFVGGPSAVLTLIDATTAKPSAEVRQALARAMGEFEVRASAAVFEGEGFEAAAVRSVVTGMNLLARLDYSHKIFARVEEASTWLVETAELGREKVRVDALTKAVASLRANGQRGS